MVQLELDIKDHEQYDINTLKYKDIDTIKVVIEDN